MCLAVITVQGGYSDDFDRRNGITRFHFFFYLQLFDCFILEYIETLNLMKFHFNKNLKNGGVLKLLTNSIYTYSIYIIECENELM